MKLSGAMFIGKTKMKEQIIPVLLHAEDIEFLGPPQIYVYMHKKKRLTKNGIKKVTNFVKRILFHRNMVVEKRRESEAGNMEAKMLGERNKHNISSKRTIPNKIYMHM